MYKGSFGEVHLCLSGGASIPLTFLKKFEKMFYINSIMNHELISYIKQH